jgi:hypothetical protein
LQIRFVLPFWKQPNNHCYQPKQANGLRRENDKKTRGGRIGWNQQVPNKITNTKEKN